MGRKTTVWLAALLLAMAMPCAVWAQTRDTDEVTDRQKRLVADLSGWRDPPGQTVPFSRSTPDERAAARSYIATTMSELGFSPALHRYKLPNVNGLVDLLFPPYRGANIYVKLPATIPTSRTVVLGAHFDSEFRSPGAVDNATGVALVWAVAREIAAMEARTLDFIFVFFDQEEDDEVGSRAFARFLQREELEIHSVHIADLAGWDESGTGLVQIQSPTPGLERLYRATASRLEIPLEVVGGASSDNKSFLAANMPTVGVFQAEIHPQLHRETDTYEVVDFDYLRRMTALVAEALRSLATPVSR